MPVITSSHMFSAMHGCSCSSLTHGIPSVLSLSVYKLCLLGSAIPACLWALTASKLGVITANYCRLLLVSSRIHTILINLYVH